MTLTFQINYRAVYGQRLCVVETGSDTFGWTEQQPLYLNCEGEDFWTASLLVEQPKGEIAYHYAIALDLLHDRIPHEVKFGIGEGLVLNGLGCSELVSSVYDGDLSGKLG